MPCVFSFIFYKNDCLFWYIVLELRKWLVVATILITEVF